MPEPQPRLRDAAVALDEAVLPRLRPPRPHLRTPADLPAEDRRPPLRAATAARESVAVTTDGLDFLTLSTGKVPTVTILK